MGAAIISVISGCRVRGGNMDNIVGSSRRSMLAACLAVPASWFVGRSQAQTPESVMTRPIPHSGEQLPIVGLGTAVSFPSANESQRAGLKDVIDALVAGGGKLIDTASVYGNAESVIGDIIRASNARNRIFIATKIEVRSAKAGADEFQRSLQRLRTEKVDLLQLHNVSRASQSLSQLREWKAAGRCSGAAQGRIGHHRHAMPLTPRQQATFNAAVVEAVRDLIGRAAIALWNLEQFFHVADFEVGYAPGADLPCRV